jgi:ribosomal-protein-alanine N-acetyltransferase
VFFKNIETDRLLLKKIDAGDREFIFSQFSDEDINRYLYDAEPLTDIGGADEIIAFYSQPEPRRQQRWILQRKEDGAKMGTCGFHNWNTAEASVEIGYDLKKEFRGKGYMQEALQALIDFAGHSMSVREIRACIYPQNSKSILLAEKLGFVLTGQTRTEIFRDEEYVHHLYSLLTRKTGNSP